MDDGADYIRIYDNNLKMMKRITPTSNKHIIQPVLILGFSWSEKEERLGAVLQDFTISFWEGKGKFAKEETFFAKEMQTRIWYLNYCGKWVTTNTKNQVLVWDIKHQTSNQLSRNASTKISDICEIANFKLVAVASFDKKITLWDLTNGKVFCQMKLFDGSADILRYSLNFDYLVSSGFETTIKIHRIDISKDYTLVEKLTGH